MILSFFRNLLLTFSVRPFKSQVFAAARELFSLNAHWLMGGKSVFFVCLFILDEKDLHLMGQHFAIYPLKVSSDLVCGLLHVALLAYTHRKTCVRLHPTVTFFLLGLT
jgi:hypothetical protein